MWRSPLYITIVEAEGRFFVRQYKFGRRSWYDAFLEHPEGVMKLGETVIPIDGMVPTDLDEINPKVNKAYFRKLNILYPLKSWKSQLEQYRDHHSPIPRDHCLCTDV